MAEQSLFWTTNDTGDGAAAGYSAAQYHLLFRALFAKTANRGGVSPDYLNELAVTGSSSPVSVATGAAVVGGVPYQNTAAVAVAAPTPSGATRIDRIVLRASWSAQTVRVTRIAGSEGGAAPDLTQSDGVTWDIPLAQVSITTGGAITVTDEREWLDVTGDAAVVEAKLGTGAVTEAKIGTGAVTEAKLDTGAVTETKLGAGAVATAKLADGAVIEDKLGTGAVTETKLGSAAVATAKLADGAVTEGKIGAGAVTEAKIGAGAVATAKLADAGVTQAKLGGDTLRMLIIPLVTTGYYSDVTTYSMCVGYARFDKAKLPAGRTVRLAARYHAPAGYSAAVRLVYGDLSRGGSPTAVTGSTLDTTTSTSEDFSDISDDLYANLPAGEQDYAVQVIGNGAMVSLHGAHLLVEW